MRKHDIKCRLCGHRYNDPHGCEVCVQAKQQIMWPASELPILESLAAQSIRLLEANMDRLEEDMNKMEHSLPYHQHIKFACDLARALTSILGEARKLEDKAKSEMQGKPLAEKVELMLDWLVHELPQEHQQHFLEAAVEMLHQKHLLAGPQ